MLVYRYEHPDGGGPWFYRNGMVRYPLPDENLYLDNQEKYLYGCNSLESLHKYFATQKVDTKNCTIEIYDIPERYIIKLGEYQVKFLKKYIE